MAKSSRTSKENIKRLKYHLKENGCGGYLVPSVDEFMSEYTPLHAKRLGYITGFTGSNGLALILPEKSLFFTDGRYLEQAKNELDTDLFIIIDQKVIPRLNWNNYLNINEIIGYDPKLFTNNSLQVFEPLNLKSIEGNLVDKIWDDRLKKINPPIYNYKEEYAGQSTKAKITRLREFIKREGGTSIVITSPDSVCWLLNLRSSDVEYSPIMLARAIITLDKIFLFAEIERFNFKEPQQITILPPKEFKVIIEKLEGKVLIDENAASVAILDLLKNKKYTKITDPCKLWKAVKNSTEIKHAKSAHIQDAAAMCEFLSALNNDPQLHLKSEYDLGIMLTQERSKREFYVMDSFPSICGFQENGAIIHYHAGQESAKKVVGSGLLLIDSGGQYLGATTDITRTVVIGSPTSEQSKRYTEVLKGHIALSSAKFPSGLTGSHLDILARQYLWHGGNDYAHGTGHGVGSFLSVHEGPQSISLSSKVSLQPGMIISNEPGYYKTGEFGIRIENLIYVEEASFNNYLQFKQLTLVPYCKVLIILELLNQEEKAFLKEYYGQIIEKVRPLLTGHAQKWLDEEVDIKL